jgi:hypothetical protein
MKENIQEHLKQIQSKLHDINMKIDHLIESAREWRWRR